MVLVNNLCQGPGRFHILQNLISTPGVLLNQGKLNVCQLGGLG